MSEKEAFRTCSKEEEKEEEEKKEEEGSWMGEVRHSGGKKISSIHSCTREIERASRDGERKREWERRGKWRG